MKKPKISIVVNSNDDSRFTQFEARFLARTGIADQEVIRIPDATSMSEGYNRGAEDAQGEWIFFCHDDIAILDNRASNVLDRAMRNSDIFGPCGTRRVVSGNWYDGGRPYNAGAIVAPDPTRKDKYRLEVFGAPSGPFTYGIQALDGLFIACRRRVFDTLGGFDEARLLGFHTYDIDFSFRAYLAGFRCAVANELIFLHDSNVSEFSEEKLKAWGSDQERFERRFQAYFTGSPGERSHNNFPLESPDYGPIIRSSNLPRKFFWMNLFGRMRLFGK